MYDRRVARGSTVAQPVVAPSIKAEQERMASADEERRKRKLAESRKRADAEAAARALEVPPVAGRAHNAVRVGGFSCRWGGRGGGSDAPPRLLLRRRRRPLPIFFSRRRPWPLFRPPLTAPPPLPFSHLPQIQTETYLETLSDRAPEEEAGVQTEAAMNRPPAPLFVPAPVRVVSPISPSRAALLRARAAARAGARAPPAFRPNTHTRAPPPPPFFFFPRARAVRR
jgi:hypothetical protein